MNRYIKDEVENLIKNDFIWKVIKPFALAGSKFNILRSQIKTPQKVTPEINIPIYFKSLRYFTVH